MCIRDRSQTQTAPDMPPQTPAAHRILPRASDVSAELQAASVVNEDKKAVAEAIAAEAAFDAGYEDLDGAKADGTAFVFLGHGTSHTAKVSYSQMQTQMKALGYDNVWIGTVEGEPEEMCIIDRFHNRPEVAIVELHGVL